MKKIIIFLCSMCFYSIAHAATWHSSYINVVYPLSSGEFVITFQNSSPACTSASKYFRVKIGENGMTKDGSDKLYAAALAAHLANRKFSINFDETSGGCYVNRGYVNAN